MTGLVSSYDLVDWLIMRHLAYQQTGAYSRFMEAQGWQVVGEDGAWAYIRRFSPLPLLVAKFQRWKFGVDEIQAIENIIGEQKPLLSYVELDVPIDSLGLSEKWRTPGLELEKLGFKSQSGSYLPTKTRVIDLDLTEEKLLAGMKSKTRYNIGLAERSELCVRIVKGDKIDEKENEVRGFLELINRNDRRLGMPFGQGKRIKLMLNSFSEESFMVLVYSKSEAKLLAGAMFVESETSVFYRANGSTNEGRTLMAPSLAIWSGIVEGKRRGKRWFDFDGVMDERFGPERWRGLSRFKAGFGGNVIYYPACYRRVGWR